MNGMWSCVLRVSPQRLIVSRSSLLTRTASAGSAALPVASTPSMPTGRPRPGWPAPRGSPARVCGEGSQRPNWQARVQPATHPVVVVSRLPSPSVVAATAAAAVVCRHVGNKRGRLSVQRRGESNTHNSATHSRHRHSQTCAGRPSACAAARRRVHATAAAAWSRPGRRGRHRRRRSGAGAAGAQRPRP